MPALRLEAYKPDRHYDLIASWWKARGDDCLPADVLPPMGALACDGETPLAACFVYMLTGTKAAYMAWPIAAPELTPRMTYEAMRLSIRATIEMARMKGATMLWSSTAHDGVAAMFEREGLTRTTPHHNFFGTYDGAVSPDMLVGPEFKENA